MSDDNPDLAALADAIVQTFAAADEVVVAVGKLRRALQDVRLYSMRLLGDPDEKTPVRPPLRQDVAASYHSSSEFRAVRDPKRDD